jgi:hypothetical protein
VILSFHIGFVVIARDTEGVLDLLL